MLLKNLITSGLLIAGIALLFNITFEGIKEDILQFLKREKSLKTRVKETRGTGRKSKIITELKSINDALIATGKGGQFATICGVSISLFISGIVFAMVIDNIFLVPILAVAFAVLPFLYAKSMKRYYDKHIEDEIQTALSVITTSYIRTGDLLKAVSENVNNIKPPIRGIFKNFLNEAFMVNADLSFLIQKLKEKIQNDVYKEWCDALLQCQSDQTLKHTLEPIVGKLSDIRLINSELNTILYEPKKEYFVMVAMVLGNIPLLYLLNKSWYETLIHTMPGKFVLGVVGLVVFITALFMMKYTKPISFRR